MLERLREDLHAAVKRRDETTVGCLRMALADIHNRKIASGEELDDEEIVEVLRKAVKMRQEAAEQFEAGGRAERAEQERAEIAVLEAYLPRMLEGDELAQVVDEIIAETGASSPSDMGNVMGKLMSRHRGRIDGKSANQLVRERLAG